MTTYIGCVDELPRINYGHHISDPPEHIKVTTVKELVALGVTSMISNRRAALAADLKSVHGIELEVRPCELFVALRPGDVLISIHEALLPARVIGPDGEEVMDTFIFHRRTVSDSQRRYS